MGINRMTGTSWHTEQVHRNEGDERRYKGRCRYYEYDGNHCTYLCNRCIGSAHCSHYESISEQEFKRRQMEERTAQKRKSTGDDDDIYWY